MCLTTYDIVDSDLEGRLRNIKVTKDAGIRSLFEATVNSLQSIFECECPKNHTIKIRMLSSIKTLDGENSTMIDGFEIVDDGVGFTEENYKSFNTLDSRHKIEYGCKGIGRLLWLCTFNKITIESVFQSSDGKFRRIFEFKRPDWICNEVLSPSNSDIKTIIRLTGVRDEYREQIPKTSKAMAYRLFDHCASYFIPGDAPIVKVVLNEGDDEIVNDVLKEVTGDYKKETFSLAGYEFEIMHVRFKRAISASSNVWLCSNRLAVEKFDIDGTFIDQNGEKFRYCGYVSSKLLDDSINNMRDGFELGETTRRIDDPDKPSLREIRSEIISKVDKYLEGSKENYNNACSKRLDEFTNTDIGKVFTAAKCYDPDLIKKVKPTMTDEELFSVCTESQNKIESELIFRPLTRSSPPFSNGSAIEKELKKIENIHRDQLTRLILHRNLILSTYQNRLNALNIEYDRDKTKIEYEVEKTIHNLILPRGTDMSNMPIYESCNLWLLDERINTYAFLGAYSDKRLCDISPKSDLKDRPDIVLFGRVDDSNVAESIAIIELKRPNRGDQTIVDQILDYVRALSKSEILNYRGNKISVTKETSYFCYGVCDTTSEKIQQLMEDRSFKKQFGGRGYFLWHPNHGASIEIIDHHKVFSDAKLRNMVFFKMLGIEVDSSNIIMEKNESNESTTIRRI